MLIQQSNCQLPYHQDYCYVYGEVQIIFESTLAEVFKNTNLHSFDLPTLPIVEQEGNGNIYYTELLLRESENGYSDKERFHLRGLNQIFKALKFKYMNAMFRQESEYQTERSAYENEIKEFGYSIIDPKTFEKRMDDYQYFIKQYQYFLFCDIEFLSLRRLAPNSNRCILRFGVTITNN